VTPDSKESRTRGREEDEFGLMTLFGGRSFVAGQGEDC
jgi:hypothetical protein